jgi:hypothetical protein
MQKSKADFKKGGAYFSAGIKRDVWDAKEYSLVGNSVIQTQRRVDTHFILDGSSGKMILLNIWISQKSFGSKSELRVFSKQSA